LTKPEHKKIKEAKRSVNDQEGRLQDVEKVMEVVSREA